MKCDRIWDSILDGAPLSEAAQAHCETCKDCQAMLNLFAESKELATHPAAVRPEPMKSVQKWMVASLVPVRAMPSDTVLVLRTFAVFIGFTVLAAFPLGYSGFEALTMTQKLAYYGVTMALALLFSTVIVGRMIPGSKISITSQNAVTLALSALALSAILLFRNFNATDCVRLGVPCLRLGSITALIAGSLAGVLLRKGYITSFLETSITVGCFAGLSGFAMLALTCPFQNTTHILIWHLGTLVLGGLGGAMVGLVQRRILWKSKPVPAAA